MSKRRPRTAVSGRRDNTQHNKDKKFSLQCRLKETGENFTLKNIFPEMKIGQLKSHAEFITGIPFSLQRMFYLDAGDMSDDSTVRYHDIVPGATITMSVWSTWATLIQAIIDGDVQWIFSLGVTPDADFSTPISDYMAAQSPQIKKEYLKERAVVALFVAAHRGNYKLCKKLLESGANVNGKTTVGRSALHMAAAKGHGSIVDLLLENGADISAADKFGETPQMVAENFGNKACERHLFLFQWQQRAKQTLRNHVEVGLFAHQYFDSTNPVWLKGSHAQVYMSQILPPGQYEGTAFSAPLRKPRLPAGSGDNKTSTEQHTRDKQKPCENSTVQERPRSPKKTVSINVGSQRRLSNRCLSAGTQRSKPEFNH